MKEMLLPATRQKSYYGKAKIIYHDSGEIYLKSYESLVCKINKNHTFEKLWNGYSHTTMKHINDFRDYFNFEPLTKKEWLNFGDCKPVYRVVYENIITHNLYRPSNIFETEEEAWEFIENSPMAKNPWWFAEVKEV